LDTALVRSGSTLLLGRWGSRQGAIDPHLDSANLTAISHAVAGRATTLELLVPHLKSLGTLDIAHNLRRRPTSDEIDTGPPEPRAAAQHTSASRLNHRLRANHQAGCLTPDSSSASVGRSPRSSPRLRCFCLHARSCLAALHHSCFRQVPLQPSSGCSR